MQLDHDFAEQEVVPAVMETAQMVLKTNIPTYMNGLMIYVNMHQKYGCRQIYCHTVVGANHDQESWWYL